MIAPPSKNSEETCLGRSNLSVRFARWTICFFSIAAAICIVWLTVSSIVGDKAFNFMPKDRNEARLISEERPSISIDSYVKEGVEQVSDAKAAKARNPHEGMRLAANGSWQPADRPYRFNWKKVHGVMTNNAAIRSAQLSPAQNATEQVMVRIFTRERGDAPLPLPPELPEDEIVNILVTLLRKDEITASDSEELAMSKEILNDAKSALSEYLRNGGEVADFIVAYHEELERCYFKRADAEEYLFELIQEEDDPAIIAAMTEKINEGLMQEGIKPIDNPAQLMENTLLKAEGLLDE